MFSRTVCFLSSTIGLSLHTVWITIFGTSHIHDTDRPVVLTDKVESVANMPVARWMYLGSVARVRNSHRNVKHV